MVVRWWKPRRSVWNIRNDDEELIEDEPEEGMPDKHGRYTIIGWAPVKPQTVEQPSRRLHDSLPESNEVRMKPGRRPVERHPEEFFDPRSETLVRDTEVRRSSKVHGLKIIRRDFPRDPGERRKMGGWVVQSESGEQLFRQYGKARGEFRRRVKQRW